MYTICKYSMISVKKNEFLLEPLCVLHRQPPRPDGQTNKTKLGDNREGGTNLGKPNGSARGLKPMEDVISIVFLRGFIENFFLLLFEWGRRGRG